eukprot:6306887-Amphidinium_carterae.1
MRWGQALLTLVSSVEGAGGLAFPIVDPCCEYGPFQSPCSGHPKAWSWHLWRRQGQSWLSEGACACEMPPLVEGELQACCGSTPHTVIPETTSWPHVVRLATSGIHLGRTMGA